MSCLWNYASRGNIYWQVTFIAKKRNHMQAYMVPLMEILKKLHTEGINIVWYDFICIRDFTTTFRVFHHYRSRDTLLKMYSWGYFLAEGKSSLARIDSAHPRSELYPLSHGDHILEWNYCISPSMINNRYHPHPYIFASYNISEWESDHQLQRLSVHVWYLYACFLLVILISIQMDIS